MAVVTSSARFPDAIGNGVSTPRYRFGTLVSHLADAVTSDAGRCAVDPAGTAELAEKVQAAAHRAAGAGVGASAGAPPPMAKAVSGKSWRFAANPTAHQVPTR